MQHTNSGSIPRATKPPRPSRYVIRDPLDRYVGVEGARNSPPWRRCHVAPRHVTRGGSGRPKFPGGRPPSVRARRSRNFARSKFPKRRDVSLSGLSKVSGVIFANIPLFGILIS
jgi:hypothetical protein